MRNWYEHFKILKIWYENKKVLGFRMIYTCAKMRTEIWSIKSFFKFLGLVWEILKLLVYELVKLYNSVVQWKTKNWKQV